MVISRLPTGPYPDNPRSEWVVGYRVQPVRQADGLVAFEYAVWATARSQAAGDRPFLLNSHKAMIRTNHQRIALTPTGELRHVSGIAVPSGDVQGFLERDLRAYRWAQQLQDRWVDDRARELAPFAFPTYWGAPEGLDPQWVRELFQVPVAQQVQALLDQYLAGVEARRLSGDRRGTTLDLQVGAGADDGYAHQLSGTGYSNNAAYTFVGQSAAIVWGSWYRFTGVSGLSGVTIDVSHLTVYNNATYSVATPLRKMKADDVAAPTAPIDAAGFRGKTRTTAGVDWDGLLTNDTSVNSPSLNTVLQELADSYDPSAIQILEDDDGTLNGQYESTCTSYDSDTTKAAKLHIEYTAGGGGGDKASFITSTKRGILSSNRVRTNAGYDASIRSVVGTATPILRGVRRNTGRE